MAVGAAAQELQLKRGEFASALHVGLVRVLVQQGGARPRVRREEVDRLRSQDGFPEALWERVHTVGTAEGAQLLRISPDHFTKLARAGCLTPITFYLNRYRTVVWLYLAQELAEFAARESQLLVGKSPAWVCSRLTGGADFRARNWRSRRIERLMSLTDALWARAAVLAGTLDPVQLAEVVDDPYERAYLARIRPEPVFGPTGSPSAREAMGRLMQAGEPDEMLWRRVGLITELDNAREARPAPRPGGEWRPGPGNGLGLGLGLERGQEPELEHSLSPNLPRSPNPSRSSTPTRYSVPSRRPSPHQPSVLYAITIRYVIRCPIPHLRRQRLQKPHLGCLPGSVCVGGHPGLLAGKQLAQEERHRHPGPHADQGSHCRGLACHLAVLPRNRCRW
ncbi:DUF6397 family protein [Streptomyces sp. NPDC088246]|uniref:DUF6397 family protein n=1 Tax=Streptomyces sp. NPDC088246 TaxID=3365842 RepID=UPI0037FC70B6